MFQSSRRRRRRPRTASMSCLVQRLGTTHSRFPSCGRSRASTSPSRPRRQPARPGRHQKRARIAPARVLLPARASFAAPSALKIFPGDAFAVLIAGLPKGGHCAAGLPVTAHAHALPAVRQVLGAGVDGIETAAASPRRSPGPRRPGREIAAAGTAVCAALGSDPSVVVPSEVLAMAAAAGITEAALQAVTRRLHAAGARIVAGASDGGLGPAKPHGLLPRTLDEVRAIRNPGDSRTRRGHLGRRRRLPPGRPEGPHPSRP